MLAITFLNKSHLADVSDYEYEVLIGGGTNVRILESGFVRGHKRADGWEKLIKRFLKSREVDNGNG